MKLTLLTLLGASAIVSAHYTFPTLIVDGQKSGYYQYVRMTKNHYSHASIQDVTSKDMRCGAEETFPSNASVKAVNVGANVGFVVEGGLGHPGPLQFYMAQAPAGIDLPAWDGSGKVWFKIAGDAPKVDPKTGLIWPQQGATTVSVRLPASLPSGNYLLRVEQIALHGAASDGGAQIYIECAQLKVSGTGHGVPEPKVAFPGAYSKADPGIKMQLYWPTPTGYVMPGPPIWKG